MVAMRNVVAMTAGAFAFVTGSGCYWLDLYSDLSGGSGASGDAGGDADATDASVGGRFCATRTPAPTFCADFDEGRSLSSDWGVVQEGPPGALVIDRDAGTSAPASLRASVPAVSNGPQSLEYVARAFTVTKRLAVEFDARADTLGSSAGQVTLVAIYAHDSAAMVDRSLIHYVTSLSAQIEEEEAPPFQSWPHALANAPPLGQWVHHELRMDLVNGGAVLTLKIANATVLDAIVLGQAWSAGEYRVTFGLAYINNDAGAPWSFHYDNIAVNVE